MKTKVSIRGIFKFTHRKNGVIVKEFEQENLWCQGGHLYLARHFFANTSSITTFHMGLILNTGGGYFARTKFKDTNVTRDWQEAQAMGNRKVWVPDLTNFTPGSSDYRVGNFSTSLTWTNPGSPAQNDIAGAFITHDDTTPYTTPNSGNSAKNSPLLAGIAATNAFLENDDTLDIVYSCEINPI